MLCAGNGKWEGLMWRATYMARFRLGRALLKDEAPEHTLCIEDRVAI